MGELPNSEHTAAPTDLSLDDRNHRFHRILAALSAYTDAGAFTARRVPRNRIAVRDGVDWLLRFGFVKPEHPLVSALKQSPTHSRTPETGAGSHWMEKRVNMLASALYHLTTRATEVRSAEGRISATKLAAIIDRDRERSGLPRDGIAFDTIARTLRQALGGEILCPLQTRRAHRPPDKEPEQPTERAADDDEDVTDVLLRAVNEGIRGIKR
jgi:hypothetical protein